MSDVIGRGVIEVSTDAQKLHAGIDDAKRKIKDLGIATAEVNKSSAASIDKYVRALGVQAVTIGKTTREAELMKLGLRGATDAQLAAADAALKSIEINRSNAGMMASINTGLIAAAAAATTVATAYAALAISNINLADHLKNLSRATKIGVEDLAGLSLLAKQSGTDLDGLARGINRMSVEMGKSPDEFRALGITAKDSIGALKQFADIFNLLPDVQMRNALAQKVFSKSWAEMAPVLSAGGEKIGEVIEKGKRLSGITQEVADRAHEFNDRLEELKISSAALGAELVPTLTRITQEMLAAKDGSTGFVDALSRFFSIGGDQGEAPEKAIAEIDIKLTALRKTAEEFAGMGLLKRIFSAEDIAIVNAQIARLATQREMLAKLVVAPTVKNNLDAATQGIDPADASGAAARAKAFLGVNAELAKAQLSLDLDQIRKASEVTLGTFANAEKIMQAMRAAGLVSDQAYYAAKLGFLNLNSQAQETDLQKEIARLQQEELIGKDKVENDKKILEMQAKLAKVRADAAAGIRINSIQETAAIDAVRLGYRDAEAAARDYLDVILRTQARELAGMGAGTLERSRAAGRAQIEDKYSEELRALIRSRTRAEFAGTFGPEAQAKYDNELDRIRRFQGAALSAYDVYYAERLQKESDWSVGAGEAMRNYYDEAKNVAKQTETAFASAFKNIEDAEVAYLMQSEVNWRNVTNAIIADLIRIEVRKANAGLVELFDLGGGSTASMAAAAGNSGSNEGALLGSFAAGTDYVPRTGPYLLHEGERVSRDAADGGMPAFTLNVYNQSKQPVDVQTSAPRFDGKRMVVDAFLSDLKTNAGTREQMRSLLAAPA